MMYGALGENFQKGLKKYLDEFEYGSAATDDLWFSFTKVCHQSQFYDIPPFLES